MNRRDAPNLPAIGWWSLVAGAALVLLGLANVLDVTAARALDAASWTLSALLAAVLAWTARRRAAPAHARSLGWIAAGLTAFALGWLVRAAQRLAGYDAPVTPADLLDLCLGPCVAIGLLLEGLRLADRVQRKTLLLDAAMLAVVVTMLVFALYLPAHGEPSWPVVLAAAPSASLFVAAGVGLIVAPAVRLRFSAGYAAFLLALVLTGLAWMARIAQPEGGGAFGTLAVPGVLGLGLTQLRLRLGQPALDLLGGPSVHERCRDGRGVGHRHPAPGPAVGQLLLVVVTLSQQRTHLGHDLVKEVVDVALVVPLTKLGRLEVLVEHLFGRERHGSPRRTVDSIEPTLSNRVLWTQPGTQPTSAKQCPAAQPMICQMPQLGSVRTVAGSSGWKSAGTR